MRKLFIFLSFLAFNSIFIFLMFYFVPTKNKSSKPNNIDWHSLNLVDERIKSGKIHYDLRCKKCHGVKGNATEITLKINDAKWHNIDGDYQSIYNVIYSGIPTKGMYGWGKKLTKTDIINLTLYVKQISQKLN